MNIGKAMTCLLIAIFAFPAILTAQMFTPWGENVTPGRLQGQTWLPQ